MSLSGTFRPTGQCDPSILGKKLAELQQYCTQRSISIPDKNPPGRIFRHDYMAAAYLYDMGFDDKDDTLRDDSRRLLLSLLPLNHSDMGQRATEVCGITGAANLTKGKICEAVLATILDNGEVPGATRAAPPKAPRPSPRPAPHDTAQTAAPARQNDLRNTSLHDPESIDTRQRPRTATSVQGWPRPARSQMHSTAPPPVSRSPNPNSQQQRNENPKVNLPDGYSPNQDLEGLRTMPGYIAPRTEEEVKLACIRIATHSINKWPDELPELAEARNRVQWVTELVDVCHEFAERYAEIQQTSQENETSLARALEKVVAASEAMCRQTERFTERFAEIMSRSPREEESLNDGNEMP